MLINTTSWNITEKNGMEGSDSEQDNDAGSSNRVQKVTIRIPQEHAVIVMLTVEGVQT